MGLIEDIVSDNLSGDSWEINELTDHGSAQVYLVSSNARKLIVRIGRKKEPIQNNVLALKILKDANYVPKIVSEGKIGKEHYSIETFIGGKKKSLTLNNLKNLIEEIKKIHKIKFRRCGYLSNLVEDWEGYFLENHVMNYRGRFSSRVQGGEKYFDFIEKNFPKSVKSFSLLHGDYSFTNSLFESDKVNFFDFEDSFVGEKEYDLAMIYYMELLPHADLIDLISKEYDRYKILFYSLCIGIRKTVFARSGKHFLSRLRRLEIVYEKLKGEE